MTIMKITICILINITTAGILLTSATGFIRWNRKRKTTVYTPRHRKTPPAVTLDDEIDAYADYQREKADDQ